MAANTLHLIIQRIKLGDTSTTRDRETYQSTRLSLTYSGWKKYKANFPTFRGFNQMMLNIFTAIFVVQLTLVRIAVLRNKDHWIVVLCAYPLEHLPQTPRNDGQPKWSSPISKTTRRLMLRCSAKSKTYNVHQQDLHRNLTSKTYTFHVGSDSGWAWQSNSSKSAASPCNSLHSREV